MGLRSFVLSTSFLCAAVVAADVPVLAQDKPQADGPARIEKVTVTARRNAEVLQDTPVSVTSLDNEALKKFYIRNLADLNHAAPNFIIEGIGATARSSASIFSRGIGYQGVDNGIEPSVGIAIDGLFLPTNIGGLQSMFDLKRVELLRGPQGTLFGKNTTGGVVLISTADPTDQYELSGNVRYGNFGRSDFYLTANAPLTDTLNARFSAMSQYSDGPFKNTYIDPVTGLSPGLHTGGDNTQAYRAKLKWEPNDNLTAEFMGQYFSQRQSAAIGQNASVAQPRTAGGVGAGDLLANPPYNRPGIGYPGGPTDPFTIKINTNGYENIDNYMGVLNVDYHTTLGFDIVSITSGLAYTSRALNDFDGTDLPYFTAYTGPEGNRMEMFSQELRVVSNDDSKLHWQAGAFYYNKYWYSTSVNKIMTSQPTVTPATFVVQNGISEQDGYALAGYAHAEYELVPNLIFSGGARYSYEEKTLGRAPSSTTLVLTKPFALSLHASGDWADFTYDFGARYRLSDDAMVYASYSTGAKAGGLPSSANSAATLIPFEPETAEAIEVGAKTQWFDDRLQLNVAGFWNEYGDLQISAFRSLAAGAPLSVIIANSAYERARGVELEAIALPFENLTLTASIGYLDAQYTSFKADLQYVWPGHPCRAGTAAQITAGTADYLVGTVVDHAQPGPCHLIPMRSPEWNGRLDASYDIALGSSGYLTPHIGFHFQTEQATSLNNAPQGMMPSWSELDMDVSYEDPSGRYRVSLWGKNVTDSLHRIVTNAPTNLFSVDYYSNPRTFGIDLTMKLGTEGS